MADAKLAAPAPLTVPESEAATVAPSTSSISDMEKVPSSGNRNSADPVEAVNEKGSAVVRSPTASSTKAGDALQKSLTREDGSEYPTGLKLGLITLALCLSVFLMALDNSIIATAIPKITDQFHSLSDVGWYGSAYLLTTASLQLLFGRFYTFFSIKWVYLVAIGLFEIGSLICGAAPNSVALILGRAVAGVGSAGIFSGALIILAHSVPLAKRPMYTGFIGSMYGIASVSGPLLGGVFTDEATWRWCFYINLPIGAITIVVIAIFFPDPRRTTSKDNSTWAERFWLFDPIGTILFMPAVICLLLALQWGGTKYEWDSARIIVLFVLFGVLIIAFLFVQWKGQERATVPPRVFKNRTVWSSSIYSFFTGSAFLAAIYYLPIWFQAVKGASAVRSGIMNLPMLIAVVIFSIGAGVLVTVLGYYTPFMIAGTVLMSIGYGLITTFDPDTPSKEWIGYQIIAGAGVGLGMQQPLMAVQTVLDIKDVPTGTSVIAFMQVLGGALFVSVAQTVFTNELVDGIIEHAPGLNPQIVLATGATSIQSTIPEALLEGVTLAYSNALTRSFIVATVTAVITAIGAAFVEWKSVKGKNIEMAVA